jgi:hypothetical protein
VLNKRLSLQKTIRPEAADGYTYNEGVGLLFSRGHHEIGCRPGISGKILRKPFVMRKIF